MTSRRAQQLTVRSSPPPTPSSTAPAGSAVTRRPSRPAPRNASRPRPRRAASLSPSRSRTGSPSPSTRSTTYRGPERGNGSTCSPRRSATAPSTNSAFQAPAICAARRWAGIHRGTRAPSRITVAVAGNGQYAVAECPEAGVRSFGSDVAPVRRRAAAPERLLTDSVQFVGRPWFPYPGRGVQAGREAASSSGRGLGTHAVSPLRVSSSSSSAGGKRDDGSRHHRHTLASGR